MISLNSYAQELRINEVVSSNSAYLDEDGDSPDWIELYNSGSEDIDLEGYFISDKQDNPTKWRFPNIDINADDYLVIWASKKDRDYHIVYRGLVDQGDEFAYLIPNQEVDSDWNSLSFDDSTWQRGQSGFGYADGDDNTNVPPGSSSVFMRKKFEIEKIESASSILLNIDYDDAFVAYINGVEIARANINGNPPAYDQYSITDHEAVLYTGGFPEGFFLNNLSDFLQEGENVLAIQGHNVGPNSSDMTMIPFLTASFTDNNSSGQAPSEILDFVDNRLHTNFKISAEGESIYLYNSDTLLVDSIQLPALCPNVSYGVDHQSNELVFFRETTPNEANSSETFGGQSEAVIEFNHPSGLSDQIALSMTVEGDKTIRYTLDATTPTEASQIYTSPISILNTTIVRAKVFEENLIPSKTQTRSFLINLNHDLPVISLVTDPANFFDNEEGIYVLGPNDYDQNFPYFGSNIWEDWERPVHFSLFEPDNNGGFSMDAGVKIFGGWSRGHEQRSLSIFARNQYGYSEMDYPIFEDRPYEEYQSIVLRNSGNDFLNSNIRDGALTSLMKGTDLEIQAYRPAVCYINGEYWGIYNIREKANEHMPAAKFGLDPDSTRVLELDGGLDEEYRSFYDYVATNNLSSSSPYEYVESQMDIENFIIYCAAQIYVNNTDWPGNNIKFWKSPETKWRWILFDTDFGFGIWNQFDHFTNTLEFALNPNGPGWPNPPWSTLLFRKLMTNNTFRNRFVNRYADELNTRFLPQNVTAHIDSIAAISQSEMNQHFTRWGGDINTQFSAVQRMKNFANQRPIQARGHILNTLNLPTFHKITIQIDDTNKGYVQLNSLSLRDEEWKGDYFQDVPISIEAIPLEGFEFSHWSESINSSEALQVIDMHASMTLKANFKSITSTTEVHSIAGVQLFPNPSSSQLNIEFDSKQNTRKQISILSADGKHIKDLFNGSIPQGKFSILFELGELSSGSYLIHIKDNNEAISLEWIKL